MFLILDNTYFANYADDNTSYTMNQNSDSVTNKENKLKLNLDKCHFIVSGTENAKIQVDDFTITNSKKEKLLGIK